MTNKGRFSPRRARLMVLQARCGAGRYAVNVGLFRANANAGGKMFGFDLDKLWLYLAANLNRVGAARVKTASGGYVYRGGYIPFQHDSAAFGFNFRIGNGHGGN